MNLPSDLLSRGVENVYPSKEAFAARLATGAPLKIYFGIDPTGPNLHLGHATVLLKLREFQDLGHEVIILYGDFTAQIGDPSGKLAARQALSSAVIKANFKSYKKQIGKILNLKKTVFKKNSLWLGKLKLTEILKLASEFTVSQLLERDMFQERIKAGEPIYLHEFFYPMLQGYDSVALGVEAEIGANDQTFNMLAGRTMMGKRGAEKFVITTKLLVDSSGKKMGKTEGNMVTFTDAPSEVYGQVMSWPDALLSLGFEICTREPLSAELTQLIKDKPREAKMKLARAVTSLFSSASGARAAERQFIKVFQNRQLPESLPEFSVPAGTLLSEALLQAGLVKSRSDFRNLLMAGAISQNNENTPLADPQTRVTANGVFRVGKKRFVRIVTGPISVT